MLQHILLLQLLEIDLLALRPRRRCFILGCHHMLPRLATLGVEEAVGFSLGTRAHRTPMIYDLLGDHLSVHTLDQRNLLQRVLETLKSDSPLLSELDLLEDDVDLLPRESLPIDQLRVYQSISQTQYLANRGAHS